MDSFLYGGTTVMQELKCETGVEKFPLHQG